ncbi:amidohydrolase family protein [Pseudomonas cremoricolorata]|uniref:2-pyrone-4,6-dicarboxylate hydrolase n=1 Tax=Pseudomonas cremoricolorata TaxID=157783 RepID=A0A089WNR3_9PSED|nr:amidohydrolase family protein [Pseudomonas cremoricolorata]AIR90955.1 2-pyrone-4,6-dicarboxylate hydrolase [Pseudomonas cremoricolorata]
MSLTRRRFIQASSALGALVSFGALAKTPFSLGDQPPRLIPPAGSVDCHMHLYDDRFPTAADATLFPPNASLADYQQLQRRLGLKRMVIVTPSTYGTDNRIMLDGLARSQGAARGIAVVERNISDQALQAMDEAGVRGIRFNLSVGGAALEGLESLAARVQDLGWHVQLATGPRLAELAERLSKLPGKLVIDHFGHVPQPEGVDSAAFAALQRLLDQGNTWVKLSAPYLRSQVGAPGYGDVGKVAQALVERNVERLLWGSDWPHPTLPVDGKPDDAAIFDLLSVWAPEPRAQAQILRDNPVSLYGF